MDQNVIEKLASEMLDEAVKQTMDEPLMKHASEETQTDRVAQKLAATFEEAYAYNEKSAEAYGAAESQEKLARDALSENGIDPDEFLKTVFESGEEGE